MRLFCGYSYFLGKSLLNSTEDCKNSTEIIKVEKSSILTLWYNFNIFELLWIRGGLGMGFLWDPGIRDGDFSFWAKSKIPLKSGNFYPGDWGYFQIRGFLSSGLGIFQIWEFFKSGDFYLPNPGHWRFFGNFWGSFFVGWDIPPKSHLCLRIGGPNPQGNKKSKKSQLGNEPIRVSVKWGKLRPFDGRFLFIFVSGINK